MGSKTLILISILLFYSGALKADANSCYSTDNIIYGPKQSRNCERFESVRQAAFASISKKCEAMAKGHSDYSCIVNDPEPRPLTVQATIVLEKTMRYKNKNLPSSDCMDLAVFKTFPEEDAAWYAKCSLVQSKLKETAKRYQQLTGNSPQVPNKAEGQARP